MLDAAGYERGTEYDSIGWDWRKAPGDWMAPGAEKTPFFGAIFILKTIILPRQALDKHKEMLKREAFCFCACCIRGLFRAAQAGDRGDAIEVRRKRVFCAILY